MTPASAGNATQAPSDSLPVLYAPWIGEVISGQLPEERHATCSACAMCPPTAASAPTASAVTFDPGAKCCTYIPSLPNFLVGAVLANRHPSVAAGRATVERRIASGTGVTPLGLQPDPHYALIYKHAGKKLFGRPGGFRCPHYLPADGGQCGIWQHRNAVCATWFCKYERGQTGQRFWNALLQLLMIAERHLALWAAEELGEPLTGLGPALLPYYATATTSSRVRWSPRWEGKVEEFYRVSAELVGQLSWNQVQEIGGPELALLAGRVRAASSALSSELVPERLRLGVVATIPSGAGQCAITGYSISDMPRLPISLAARLDRFDGRRPTEQVCLEIGSEVGTPLDKAMVRRLVDYGVLVAVPTPGGAAPHES